MYLLMYQLCLSHIACKIVIGHAAYLTIYYLIVFHNVQNFVLYLTFNSASRGVQLLSHTLSTALSYN